MKIVLIIGICLQCCCMVRSSFYLEDSCRANKSESWLIRLGSLSWSSAGHVRASRAASYQKGRNCTVVISSPYDVIVSIKKIRFRPGCQDFLKIADERKSVALCGSKNELDSNMQYYGKRILMHYFTDAEGPKPDGYSGFHLTYTPGQRGVICNKKFKFLCDNGYCINNYFMCDSNNNCGDFSDERKCGRNGIVTFIAMFIVSIMGVVGGFCISMCVSGAVSKRLSRRRNSQNLLDGGDQATAGRF